MRKRMQARGFAEVAVRRWTTRWPVALLAATALLGLFAGCGGHHPGGGPCFPGMVGGAGGGAQQGTLTVTVFDLLTQRTIGEATVWVEHGSGAVASSTADAAGVVTFTGLTSGPVSVTAQATGYVTTTFVGVDAREVALPAMPRLSQLQLAPITARVTGLPASFIGGGGVAALSQLSAPEPMEVAIRDDGQGNAVVDPTPTTTAVDPFQTPPMPVEVPTAVALVLRDPAGLSYVGGLLPLAGGLTAATYTVPLAPIRTHRVEGTLDAGSLSGLVNLATSTTEVAVGALLDLGAGGRLVTAGGSASSTATTTAVFDETHGNAFTLAELPCARGYGYVAQILWFTPTASGSERLSSVQLVRGSFDDLAGVSPVLFNTFKEPVASLAFTTSTQTITWSAPDPPGAAGGLYIVSIGPPRPTSGPPPEDVRMLFVAGDRTEVSVPSFAQLPAGDYVVNVNVRYALLPASGFSTDRVMSSHTHSTSHDHRFTVP